MTIKKLNNNLNYLNISSDHPPSISKRLSNFINYVLWINSSNKEFFDNNKEDYQKELYKSSFKPNFHIKKVTKVAAVETVAAYKTTVKPYRKSNRVWFKSPFNKIVVIHVTKIFLELLKKYFSKKY